jgi:tellurite resistance protein
VWLVNLTTTQREALLGLAHNVVVSDGLLDPNEEGMLKDFKREMGVSANIEPEYLELEGIGQIFESRQARVIAIINLLRVSYADGAFEIEEECLLREITQAFEISAQDFLLLDNWVRRLLALEEEAQVLIRNV